MNTIQPDGHNIVPNSIKMEDLPKLVGRVGKPSSWLEISQQRVNQFADVTNDHQFIHVNPKRAAKTPFDGTIAHGFLTLSLVTYLTAQESINPEDLAMVINYGSDKVRYLQPVRVGNRIRAHQKLINVTEKQPGQMLIKNMVTIEIENTGKPALIAELLALFVRK